METNWELLEKCFGTSGDNADVVFLIAFNEAKDGGIDIAQLCECETREHMLILIGVVKVVLEELKTEAGL